MAIEFELKFRATQQDLFAIGQAYPGEQVHYQMHTTYYDTPSGSLSQRFYTLRRRMENGVSVCTLKAPAPNNERMELELVCPDVRQALPVFYQQGAPRDLEALVQEGLLEICGARFERTAILLTLEDCQVELALDQGVLYSGEISTPLCEVEVELKAGSKQSAIFFAKMLSVQYGLQQERKSKFRRALALYKGDGL